MTPHRPPPQSWAQHLAGSRALPRPGVGLTAEEAARVQRYRDQLLDALRAQDRPALRSAKQQVLEAAFGSGGAAPPQSGPASPAVRRALRDLAWRMAGVLLVRGSHR